MTRQDLKEIILLVIDRLQNESPRPACAFLWSDETWQSDGGGGVYTTIYGVAEEATPPTTVYAVNEEDPEQYPE